MRIPKIFLETTIFNYYFDKERDAHPYTVKLFDEIGEGKYAAFTSASVMKELLNAPEEKRDKMLALIEKFGVTVLDISEEAENLADIYMEHGIIPRKFSTDALHVATATVNDLDIILSLNFRHIVKKKTIELTELVNIGKGYRNVQIYSPMEVVENVDEQV